MLQRDAIAQALVDLGRPARAREIADVIAERGYYVRRDGSRLPSSDVNVTANDNKHVFAVDRGLISLRQTPEESSRQPVRVARSGREAGRPIEPDVVRSLSRDFWDQRLNLTLRPNAPLPGARGLPEVRGGEHLRAAGATDVELRLWLTLVAAMDRARDADGLRVAGVRLWQQHRWAFVPEQIVSTSVTGLADVLRGSGVSRRHAQDTVAWRVIAEALNDRTNLPAVCGAIYDGEAIAPELLTELHSTTAAGTARLPWLRGPKLARCGCG